ncbi:MAG: hypothetical protein M1833_006817 [Piccolia ochrophora]|nr:MAG: hypothetical protein M1833_006817 [Piccolia ochrophora]
MHWSILTVLFLLALGASADEELFRRRWAVQKALGSGDVVNRQVGQCAESDSYVCVGGGCCPIGVECGYNDDLVPICETTCLGGPSCGDGTCCDYDEVCVTNPRRCRKTGASIILPSISLPSISLPSYTLPTFSLPTISLPDDLTMSLYIPTFRTGRSTTTAATETAAAASSDGSSGLSFSPLSPTRSTSTSRRSRSTATAEATTTAEATETEVVMTVTATPAAATTGAGTRAMICRSWLVVALGVGAWMNNP